MSSEIAPAPGGSLAEFADYLKETGQDHFMSGGQLWVPGSSGELFRQPVHCTEDVDEQVARQILKLPGVRVLTSLREVDAAHAANCILYLCQGAPYGMDRLTRNARKVIRRGTRHFENRRCTWDELASHGYAAFVETDQRHGYATRSPEEFQTFVRRHQAGDRFFEVWGAWHGETLAGWVLLSKTDNFATFLKVCSRTDYMSKAPNNILHFLPMEAMLNEEGRRYVSTGFSSIQQGAEMGLHDFKIRLGFDAIPVHRTFIIAPHMRPFVASQVASRIWDAAARLLPKYSKLRKLAGMSQVLSGRQQDPLHWLPESETTPSSALPR